MNLLKPQLIVTIFQSLLTKHFDQILSDSAALLI